MYPTYTCEFREKLTLPDECHAPDCPCKTPQPQPGDLLEDREGNRQVFYGTKKTLQGSRCRGEWSVQTFLLVWGEADQVNSCCGDGFAPTLEPLLEWPPGEGKLIRDGNVIWEK